MPRGNKKSPATDAGSSTGRKERLAAELRANLLKRKAQSRDRDKAREQEKREDDRA